MADLAPPDPALVPPDPHWLVIGVNAEVDFHDGDPWGDDYGDAVNLALGHLGRNRVRVDRTYDVAGYVADVGRDLPVNVPGSVLLHSLGASQQPYRGPIAIVGWRDENTAHGLPEWAPLEPTMTRAILTLLAHIAAALMGDDTNPPGFPPEWPATVRAAADAIRNAPPPTMTIHRWPS